LTLPGRRENNRAMTPDPHQTVPSDLTPSVGSATDIAPVGRQQPAPAHELTAAEDPQIADWDKIAALDEFRALLKAKLKFITAATVFFVPYYFALPVLVGYAPALMETKVFGDVNIAYLFALSQFVMVWAVAALYVRAAGRFDKMAEAILAKLKLK
jgi:uncharacterized membrane protein (DUF485 family)